MTKRFKNKSKKRKTLKRKTLKRIYGGAGALNGKRKIEESQLSRVSPMSRSADFVSSLTRVEKKSKGNNTIKLAIKIEKQKLKEGFLRIIASPKPGGISSETRLPHFDLAKQVIKRIIDDDPTDETINIYASYITEEVALMLRKILNKFNNDNSNAELLEFMQSHNLSTLK
jgi:hypothetical protein